MSIRAVFFDVDDTLVDITGATIRCVFELARGAGARGVSADAIVCEMMKSRDRRNRLALGVSSMIEACGGQRLREAEVQRSLRRIDEHVLPDARTREAVERVRGTFKVGVISNGSRTGQRSKLRAAGLLPLFDSGSIFISGELGVRKPRAEIFELALRATGVDRTAALFVGDHEADDIAGARAVGMATCRVGPAGAVTAADYRIDHVAQLVEVLS